MTYYKVLNADRSCYNGGDGIWKPEGVPMPEIVGDLEPYKNGYHVCTANQLGDWVGPAIWEVDVDTTGMLTTSGEIVVVRQATLVRRTAWDLRSMALWALDCAERVQHLAKADTVALNAVTRRHIAGEATIEEVVAAQYACELRNPRNPGSAAHYANYSAGSASDAACFRDAANDADFASFGGYANYLGFSAHRASTEARSAVFKTRYEAVYERTGACESSNYEGREAEDAEKTWQANQLLTYL